MALRYNWPHTQEKLDAIGYGVFIPFFFILTGAKINIPELLASPKTLILIPLFFAAYVLEVVMTNNAKRISIWVVDLLILSRDVKKLRKRLKSRAPTMKSKKINHALSPLPETKEL